MAKPKPEPIDPQELPALAHETMDSAKFPLLATVDGDKPRLRPISPVKTEGFTVYVANLRSYKKTAQIKKNPNVELCYFAPNHDQVRITGIAEFVTDQDLIAEIWKSTPLLAEYLGEAHNPEFVLYKIVPNQVLFMREWALNYHEIPCS